MGTRCQIEFKNKYGKIMTYRHWDGYKESVITELKEFLKWNGFRNDDLSYTVANYIFYMKRMNEDNERNWIKEGLSKLPKNCNWKKLEQTRTGFGIDQFEQIHGGIEWFYQVDLDNRIIKIWNLGCCSEGYTYGEIMGLSKIEEEF